MIAVSGLALESPRVWARWGAFLAIAAAFFTMASAFFAIEVSPGNAWNEVQGSIVDGAASADSMEEVSKGVQGGTLRREIPLLLMGVVGALGLRARGGVPLRLRRGAGWALAGYLALFPASLLWAADGAVSARRLAAFALMFTAVLAAVRSAPPREIVRFALLASGAYALVALVVELVTGSFHPTAAGWRLSGVFHPNTLATFLCIGALAATALAAAGERRSLHLTAAALCVALLVLTRSRTALAGLAFALALRWAARARATKLALALVLVAWLGCFAALLAGLGPPRGQGGAGGAGGAAALLERPDSDFKTFTGRTRLWEILLAFAADRPVLGHGLGGFWTARHVEDVYALTGWPASEGHSTYVDQLLELGLVGVAAYLLALLAGLRRGVGVLRREARGAAAGTLFMVSILGFAAVVGLLETVQPMPSLLCFLVFWALASLGFRDDDAAPAPEVS